MSDEESELAGYDTSIRDPSDEEVAETKARWERMTDEDRAEWTALGESLVKILEHEDKLATIFKDFPVEQSSRDIRIPMPGRNGGARP